MSNDDKRRRQDGSTAKLSVADLLARREAETQPIPRITERINTERFDDDEETVRFSAVSLASAAAESPAGRSPAGKSPATNLSGRELHVTELLRREGRAGEEERGGGFSVPKLVAMAGGGVVLAGTVAFTASSLMSSPDERPLAEVRFDARAAARGTNPLTKDLATAAKQQQVQQAQAETTTTTPEQTQQQTAQQTSQRAQQPAPRQTTTTTTTTEQAPTVQAPTSTSEQATTPPPSTGTTTPAPPSTSTPPPPSSQTTTPPPSEETGIGLGIGLDLGGILNPLGGFDFFAPAS